MAPRSRLSATLVPDLFAKFVPCGVVPDDARGPRMKTWFPLVAQFATFWSAVALIPAQSVAVPAWATLYAIILFAFLYSAFASYPNWSPYQWLAVVFYSLFLAGLFYSLNVGLDVLHGADRPKAEIAQHLGGLEIWFFLCPGVFAFAIAMLVRVLLSSPPRARAH